MVITNNIVFFLGLINIEEITYCFKRLGVHIDDAEAKKLLQRYMLWFSLVFNNYSTCDATVIWLINN